MKQKIDGIIQASNESKKFYVAELANDLNVSMVTLMQVLRALKNKGLIKYNLSIDAKVITFKPAK